MNSKRKCTIEEEKEDHKAPAPAPPQLPEKLVLKIIGTDICVVDYNYDKNVILVSIPQRLMKGIPLNRLESEVLALLFDPFKWFEEFDSRNEKGSDHE